MTYDRDNHRRAIKVANEYAERIDALQDKAYAYGGGPKLLRRPDLGHAHAFHLFALERERAALDPGHAHAFRLFTLERERAALDVLRAIHES